MVALLSTREHREVQANLTPSKRKGQCIDRTGNVCAYYVHVHVHACVSVYM